MRTVTIALLCFLLLVALDIGRVVASSEFFPLVVRSLQIAVSYLYWEICWEVYYQCTHNFEGVPLYLRFITSHLRPHSEADQDDLHDPAEKGQSQETKLPVTPTIAHITPPPVALPPAKPAPPSYPPPFEYPFTNFRGTGESFAHSDRRNPTHYSVLQLPTSWGNTRRKERDYWRSAPRQPSPAYRSTEHEKVAAAPTIPKPEVPQSTTRSKTTITKDHVVIAPAHKVVELPPIYTLTQPPPTLPSAPSIDPQLKALRDVEDKKHLVVAEMKSFLSTIASRVKYARSPAPKMGTLSAIPTTTVYLPAPVIPTAPQPQKAPSTSAPIQQTPPQQPIVAQGATALIDFGNEDWFGLPDDQLKELKWRSFNWPNQQTASLKIWHFNVLELTQLPTQHPEFIMASYVKAELEKAAPLLKRASVVFRLQGHWDSRDEWYKACQYLHENVFKDKRVWASLCNRYDSDDPDENDKEDKTGPLRRLWEKMAPTWLPDIAKP
ncbi:hypothetical protein J4E90_005023 [Alternaria incomplexa]|uniref:uncharacterized protein n=1 Tax=Alternaria incomplexa TaxID=1187928 RepID=UPI0022210555|nr:uncharacterized protein J4E90_005023 [Alternaria incomplexa]KAI4914986.1 hypothetical protein J4E90_005023 [Alternaria incomplexa]